MLVPLVIAVLFLAWLLGWVNGIGGPFIHLIPAAILLILLRQHGPEDV